MADLSYLGLSNLGTVHHNLSTPALYEEAVRRREGWIAHLGPLVVRTGQYTGRSAERPSPNTAESACTSIGSPSSMPVPWHSR